MARSTSTAAAWRGTAADLQPMLATLADAPRVSPTLAYEPKYDGIRAIVEIELQAPSPKPQPLVRIYSRRGNEKTLQFPELIPAFQQIARAVKRPLVVDGEIVALDERGRAAGFQRLQGRMHLTGVRDIERAGHAQPVAFIAFDLLRDGDEDLRPLAWIDRRRRLEARLAPFATADGAFRISEVAVGDGRALEQRAGQEGWEGLVAKDVRAPYQSGRRSPSWSKLKSPHRQEFVIGGWTEPRQTRPYFGALLLGVPARATRSRPARAEGSGFASPTEDARLDYVGHTGTGFDEKELARVYRLLKAREIPTSPFTSPIKSNEPAHWVRPELVAEVKFTEWTDDGKLRHPVYLGIRDDKRPEEVEIEAAGSRERPRPARGASEASRRAPASGRGAPRAEEKESARGPREGPEGSPAPASRAAVSVEATPGPRARARGGGAPRAGKNAGSQAPRSAELQSVVDQLRALEDARRDGVIELPGGDRLKVTNLAKVFWPDGKITKGELLRYYAEVSPYILPAVADRPLVMKRFPNGVTGPAFYQQRSRQEQPPPGVRIEVLPDELDPIREPDAKRFVGGSLITLLYMTQIAAISQDPWFSRVQSPLFPDHAAIDLDPGEGATFAKVLDVARWVRDELSALRVPGVPKSSGSSGLHIYIPLPPKTTYESGQLLCQIIATVVASKHPKTATVERTVRARPHGTVYVDYLQNILGKTLATAYSARASAFAGVSTPLTWDEVDAGVDPRDFTVRTAPARFAEVGDLWARLRTSKPADLAAVVRRYRR